MRWHRQRVLPRSRDALSRLVRGASLTVLCAASLALPCTTGGCGTLSSLAEQGRGQLQLLRNRRRISDVLADPLASEDLKWRLRLAKQARDFGVSELGLRGGDSYTRYID